MQNFDKISFLSDQNHTHLPFLSSFLETQTFLCFIDEAVMRMSSEVIIETPFERRLAAIKQKFGESLVRTPTYTPCETIKTSDEVMAARLRKVEVTGDLSFKCNGIFLYSFHTFKKCEKTKDSRKNGKIREPVGLEILAIFRKFCYFLTSFKKVYIEKCTFHIC